MFSKDAGTRNAPSDRFLALVATPVLAAVQVLAADPPAAPAVKGLWLLTDYPSQTVRPGEVANIRFKLQNAGLAPEPLALSVDGVPAGWKADILGGGQPVAAAMPGINESVEPAASGRRAEGCQARLADRSWCSAKGRDAVDRPAAHPDHRQRGAGQAQPSSRSCRR